VDRTFLQVTKNLEAQIVRAIGVLSFWTEDRFFTPPFVFWLDTGAPYMCIPPWITDAVGIVKPGSKFSEDDITIAFGYRCIVRKVRVRFALENGGNSPPILLKAKIGLPDGTTEPSDDRPLLVGMSLLEEKSAKIQIQFDSRFENDDGRIEVADRYFESL
jgi:hypothetical protein